MIVYDDPRSSPKGMVRAGEVLFRGVLDPRHKRIYGTAYVFTRD